MSEDAFLYGLTICFAGLAVLIAVTGRIRERRAERRRQADRLAMSHLSGRGGGATVLQLRPRRG